MRRGMGGNPTSPPRRGWWLESLRRGGEGGVSPRPDPTLGPWCLPSMLEGGGAGVALRPRRADAGGWHRCGGGGVSPRPSARTLVMVIIAAAGGVCPVSTARTLGMAAVAARENKYVLSHFRADAVCGNCCGQGCSVSHPGNADAGGGPHCNQSPPRRRW
jgi:hypothetical protein